MLFGIDLIMFFVSAVARLESDLCEEDEEMVTPPRCNSSDMQHNRCQRDQEGTPTLVPCHKHAGIIRSPFAVSPIFNACDGVLFMSRLQWRTTEEVCHECSPPHHGIAKLSLHRLIHRYYNAEKGYEDRSSDSIEVQSQCLSEVRDQFCGHRVLINFPDPSGAF